MFSALGNGFLGAGLKICSCQAGWGLCPPVYHHQTTDLVLARGPSELMADLPNEEIPQVGEFTVSGILN